jgi:hypothetical protein
MVTGDQRALGIPDTINCLPRFDGADDALLFCSGADADGPFRICRQHLDDAEPVFLTPEGADCLLPLTSDAAGHVLCARAVGPDLSWVRCGPDGFTELVPRAGSAGRPDLLGAWLGIAAPLSPDRRSWLYYDGGQNRICLYQTEERRLSRHRTGSIAACWLASDAIALATEEYLFSVNITTGMSPMLFNGQWIPCRYLPASHRLLLLGNDGPQRFSRRFSIVEVVFNPS